jgi:tyrosyl-tRNA synthetase
VTDLDPTALKDVKRRLEAPNVNPMEIKKELGVTVAAMYHDRQSAIDARAEFGRVFSSRGVPDEIPEFSVTSLGDKIWVVRLLTETKSVASGGEARRLIKGGGLYVDNERISDCTLEITLRPGMIVKAGKRRFFRIID